MISVEVKEGFWTDYSQSSILLGKTLTLSKSHASLLIAFLALFVGLAGSRCWTIVAFALHQLRANHRPRDAFHYQCQLVLRNADSDIGALLQLIRLVWAWKWRVTSASWAALLLALAIINTSGFTAAGILSGWVAKTSRNGTDTVLAKAANCGAVIYDNTPSTPYNVWIYRETAQAQAYARNCYEKGYTSRDCYFFAQPSIPYRVKRNDACPFEDRLCNTNGTSVVTFDTGLVDTIDLGINAPLENRVQYRAVSSCSHILIGNATVVVTAKQLGLGHPYDPNDQYILAFVGPIWNAIEHKVELEYTFVYSEDTYLDRVGYTISVVTAHAGQEDFWIPYPPLNRTDADVHVIFLTPNSVVYDAEVDDTVFAAHLPHQLGTYIPDYRVAVMGCTRQYQFCDINNTTLCTDLGGFYQVVDQLRGLSLNVHQLATAERIILSTQYTIANPPTAILGASALKAQEVVGNNGLVSGRLPKDQWQIEVQGWFETDLARLQFASVQYASRLTPLPRPGGYTAVPTDPGSHEQCHNMKVQNTGSHQSFSVLGMAIILTIGGLIILLSLFLDTLVSTIQQVSGKGADRQAAFVADHYFHLHRFAMQGAGYGDWIRENRSVPMTREREELGVRLNRGNGVLRIVPKDEVDAEKMGNRNDSSPWSGEAQ